MILMLIQLGAAIGYFLSGDWRMVVYWICAAILNIVVTF